MPGLLLAGELAHNGTQSICIHPSTWQTLRKELEIQRWPRHCLGTPWRFSLFIAAIIVILPSGNCHKAYTQVGMGAQGAKIFQLPREVANSLLEARGQEQCREGNRLTDTLLWFEYSVSMFQRACVLEACWSPCGAVGRCWIP